MRLPYSRTHVTRPTSTLGHVLIAHPSKNPLSSVVLLPSLTGSLFPPPREWIPLSERDAGSPVVLLQQASLRITCCHARPRCGPPRNRPDGDLPRDAGLNGCGIPRNSPSLLVQASVIEVGSRWTKSSQAGSSLSTTRRLLPVQGFCSDGTAFLLEREIPSFCIRK